MGFEPFKGERFADMLASHERALRERIRSLSHEHVQSVNRAELAAALVDETLLEEVGLDFTKKYQYSISQITYRISSEWPEAKGTRLTIAVPYEGDAHLLSLRPDTYYFPPTRVEIDIAGQDVLVPFSFPDEDANPQRLANEVETVLKWLGDHAGRLNDGIRLRNSRVPAIVEEALHAKCANASKALGAIEALGIPMRRVAQPAFEVPTVRRRLPVASQKAQAEAAPAEPFLADEEYQHILRTLRNMSLVIERNPKTFSSMDEEAIRDNFLLHLCGAYEGQATGETFNKAGKTDVLMRWESRNVFIAECKFWGGAAKLEETIDQLLSYLTWRDCKTALLIFNRNRDSKGVAAKMHAAMEARPEWRRTESHDPMGDSRYVFVKPDEPGREIVVTTQIYDVPAE